MKLLAWAILGVGIVLRALEYGFNRCLNLDEAALALNVLPRSFQELALPLEHIQYAPLGFLLVSKCVTNILGKGELALRLFPFLAGLLSLFLFYALAKRILSGVGVVLAVGLFACASPLIFYAADFKPYSSDVTLAIFLLLMGLRFCEKPSWPQMFLFALSGTLAIWFSYPAALVLGAIGLALGMHSLKTKDFFKLSQVFLLGSIWLFSFLAFYLYVIKPSLGGEETRYWHFSFFPWHLPFTSWLRWFVDVYFRLFDFPGGLPLKGLAGLACCVGFFSLLKVKKTQALILGFAFIFALLPVIFEVTPFRGRFFLFLVPCLFILIAAGAHKICQLTWTQWPLVGLVLLAFIFLHPFIETLKHLKGPRSPEDIRPLLLHLQKKAKQKDVIHLDYGTHFLFEYYAPRYELDDKNLALKTGSMFYKKWPQRQQEFDQIHSPRLWVLNFRTRSSMNRVNLDYLKHKRRQSDQFHTPAFTLYLFEN